MPSTKYIFPSTFFRGFGKMYLHDGWFGVDNPLKGKKHIVICKRWNHVKHHKQSLQLRSWFLLNHESIIEDYCTVATGFLGWAAHVQTFCYFCWEQNISIDISNKKTSHFCGISGHPNVQTHSNLASKLHVLVFRIFRPSKSRQESIPKDNGVTSSSKMSYSSHHRGTVLFVTSC